MNEDNLTFSDSPRNRGTTVEQCQRMIHKSLLCIYSLLLFPILIIPYLLLPLPSFVGSFDSIIPRHVSAPQVRFLREHLEKAGCHVSDNFIKAVKCDKTGIAGGYTKGEGIVVCCNEMESQDDVDQVLKHELIHVFDDCRAANLDWTICAHQACSEIRAGHLSGDCHLKRELLRLTSLKFRRHEQECIRRRVMQSLSANPYCSGVAKASMESVWDVCYNDTEPYDRAP